MLQEELEEEEEVMDQQKRRRRLLHAGWGGADAIAGICPCGKWLHKVRRRTDDVCVRCAKMGKTHVETVVHIHSVQCGCVP
jgi:hypothetical protein